MRIKMAASLTMAALLAVFAVGCSGAPKATPSPSVASTAPEVTSAAPETTSPENSTEAEATPEPSAESTPIGGGALTGKVAMVTDMGGVNDQSFNQSAWEGLQELQKNNAGVEPSYVESHQEADYGPNLDKATDASNDLVWGIGYAMADAIANAAKSNPDVKYAIVDNAYADTPANLTGVVFKAQEPSFLVGYIAARTTKTGKVGFVGGQKSEVIDQFEYGYRAGVAYANKEKGLNVEVVVQYAESFTDAAKGKAIASSMFSENCDIVFHAAGGVGIGVIEAAKEQNKFAIGVDRDQRDLAPDNVLTSALKLVGKAMQLTSARILSGENLGGQTLTFGTAEGCVGIPTDNPHVDPAVYGDTMTIEPKFVSGEIDVPYNQTTFDAYEASLK